MEKRWQISRTLPRGFNALIAMKLCCEHRHVRKLVMPGDYHLQTCVCKAPDVQVEAASRVGKTLPPGSCRSDSKEETFRRYYLASPIDTK